MAVRRLIIPAVLALAAGVLLPPNAFAAAASVTVNQCTESALRSAIANAPAGATIRFGCDGTIGLTADGGSTIEIQKPLTIDGTGHSVTISGQQQVSLFFISGLADIRFANLTLADGNSQDYGLVGGGAIFNGNAHLFTDHVTFRDNHAFNYGGAIYEFGAYATASITDSTFDGNTVTCSITGAGGGAIATKAGGLTAITDSTFTNNSATGLGEGGAILGALTYQSIVDGPVSVKHSTFTGNSVYTQSLPDNEYSYTGGGAIAVYNRALTIDRSTFRSNTAAVWVGIEAGGAVIIGRGDPNGPLPAQAASISNSTFMDNAAQHATDFGFGMGGGVAVVGPPTTISNSQFVSNGAAQGGGLYNSSQALRLTGSSFARNYASGFDLTPPFAGGLYSDGVATVSRTSLASNTPVNCATGSTGRIVDAGGNAEAPGHTCF